MKEPLAFRHSKSTVVAKRLVIPAKAGIQCAGSSGCRSVLNHAYRLIEAEEALTELTTPSV